MSADQKTPSKPKPTTASEEALVGHYNSQLTAYNAAVREQFHDDHKKIEELLLDPIADNDDLLGFRPPKEHVVELIRRQNHRLGRHIKARAHELLKQKAPDASQPDGIARNKHGYTVGLSYADILDVLAVEFPEASTTVACLRWYVVHMRSDAADQGLPWPDLPQVRPRSAVRKDGAAAEEAAAAEAA